MTIHVTKEIEQAIEAAVRSGRFTSAEAMVAELVREDALRTQPSAASAAAPSTPVPALWERVAALRATIPAEEWDKLPADGSANLDHYLYGSPRRGDTS